MGELEGNKLSLHAVGQLPQQLESHSRNVTCVVKGVKEGAQSNQDLQSRIQEKNCQYCVECFRMASTKNP
jgi:hypothetical protein